MGHVTLTQESTPSAPSGGTDVIYFDSADSLLKTKDGTTGLRQVVANNSHYRLVSEATAHLGSAISSGTFIMAPAASSAKTAVDVAAITFPLFQITSADYALTGMTTELRVKMQLACNATAPGTITFTGGLYPVTVAGGSSAFVPTLGTVVVGSTVAGANPSASTVNSYIGTDFAISAAADGAYALGYTTNATSATNGFVKVNIQLQMRHIPA